MTIYAIYGATGHTGRLVTADLLARGNKDVILSGRNRETLAALGNYRIHPAAERDAFALELPGES